MNRYRLWFSFGDDPETERSYQLDAESESDAKEKLSAILAELKGVRQDFNIGTVEQV